jgi:hypothetical protein
LSEETAIVRGWESAAEVAGRSVASVRKLVDGRKLSASKDSEGVRLFRRADLEGLPPVQASTPRGTEVDPASASGVEGSTASSTLSAPDPDGAVVAGIFADLEAGHDLRRIVVDRKLPPETVGSAYRDWLALGSIDLLRTPEAEARLAALEERVEALAGQLAGIEGASLEASDKNARDIEKRLRGAERRVNAAGVPTAVLQRLDALEQQVRNLPAAPLLLDRRCTCGAPLAVLAACVGCGAGRAAS